ncbi:hypothetical protein RISK_002359 [Rhodopirellula islandica]|uniref:Uncharacterized protein n=1 Tax=Rhodopirellula islandica TaxID=595434 RepID=A0A0J1BGP0_RHOIS|nr:hypothetical protein RISK_002359 [Rhodopirellula islandica]
MAGGTSDKAMPNSQAMAQQHFHRSPFAPQQPCGNHVRGPPLAE